jgi:ubiquinone/menaquinone biosynthesis C-methylase UbiE
LDHHTRTMQEFARQAEQTVTALAFTAPDLTERLLTALGPAATGCILDLACGPGIVTAALAHRAREVVAFDLTPEMLDKAQQRCGQAGLENVRFQQGQAERLPFAPASFDAVVTRLSIHHFADPAIVLAEMVRVVRPQGTIVIADVLSSDDAQEAELHNALEILRDPSHVRMVSRQQMLSLLHSSGLTIVSEATWDVPREFDEWAHIVNDATRTQPLRTVMCRLAQAGMDAGIDLHLAGEQLAFIHRWLLVVATKP